MQFNELKLNDKLLQAVDAAGFTTPTDIQREAIPIVLKGKDLMASAQTGTGKTAAFVLPILDSLLKPSQGHGKGPRVLVLTPTRELATQVNDDIRKFSRFCRLKAGSVVGGVSYGPQIDLLSRPLDLLVATPGRLMDHMGEGLVDFSRLEVLVLDEADRMLDMGFVNDVRKISAGMPRERQTLFFSATLEGDVLSMAHELMRDPVRVQLAVNTRRHDDISQHVFQADDAAHKHRLLTHHLGADSLAQAVVFTRTKRRADRLAKKLAREGYSSAALHGDMRQGARRRTVEQMREGRVRVLVATDVAARGLDISGITHVINFDMPMVAEDYIHRIGRTGRAGATGTAVSFVGPEDWELLSGVQKLTGWELERELVAGLEPSGPEPDPVSIGRGKGRGRGRGGNRGRGGRGSYNARSRSGESGASGSESGSKREFRPAGGRGGAPKSFRGRKGNFRRRKRAASAA